MSIQAIALLGSAGTIRHRNSRHTLVTIKSLSDILLPADDIGMFAADDAVSDVAMKILKARRRRWHSARSVVDAVSAGALGSLTHAHDCRSRCDAAIFIVSH